jgi:hypothetical protein
MNHFKPDNPSLNLTSETWSLAAIALFDKGADAVLSRSLRSDDRQLYGRV